MIKEIINPNVEKRNKEWEEILGKYGLKLPMGKNKPISRIQLEKSMYPSQKKSPKG